MKSKKSPLEKILDKGWMVEIRYREYLILSRDKEEIIYHVPRDKIVSLYKK